MRAFPHGSTPLSVVAGKSQPAKAETHLDSHHGALGTVPIYCPFDSTSPNSQAKSDGPPHLAAGDEICCLAQDHRGLPTLTLNSSS